MKHFVKCFVQNFYNYLFQLKLYVLGGLDDFLLALGLGVGGFSNAANSSSVNLPLYQSALKQHDFAFTIQFIIFFLTILALSSPIRTF